LLHTLLLVVSCYIPYQEIDESVWYLWYRTHCYLSRQLRSSSVLFEYITIMLLLKFLSTSLSHTTYHLSTRPFATIIDLSTNARQNLPRLIVTKADALQIRRKSSSRLFSGIVSHDDDEKDGGVPIPATLGVNDDGETYFNISSESTSTRTRRSAPGIIFL